jgi:hypothetical protein
MNKSTLKDLNDWLSGLHNKMLSSLSAKKLLDYFYCVREEELLSIDRSGTKTKFLVASVDYKQTSCLGLFETKSYNNGERNADDALIILYYDLLYGETCLVLSLTKKTKAYEPYNGFVFTDDELDDISYQFELADIVSIQKQFCHEISHHLCNQFAPAYQQVSPKDAECALIIEKQVDDENVGSGFASAYEIQIFEFSVDDKEFELAKAKSTENSKTLYLNRFVEIQNAGGDIVYDFILEKQYVDFYNLQESELFNF